ncbi:MAG: hypothetical protein KOO63_05715 [Bacteroidales bacterium]|nr:hypothetical protein [Candidatus Latescibacterota bacterium]
MEQQWVVVVLALIIVGLVIRTHKRERALRLAITQQRAMGECAINMVSSLKVYVVACATPGLVVSVFDKKSAQFIRERFSEGEWEKYGMGETAMLYARAYLYSHDRLAIVIKPPSDQEEDEKEISRLIVEHKYSKGGRDEDQ